MRILAIDPGNERSAFVLLDGYRVSALGIVPNPQLLDVELPKHDSEATVLVIEQIAAMGMAVGREVFETVFWSGRFAQSWRHRWDRVTRREVKLHLCGNMRAKDPNVRTALLDMFGPGKARAVGTKKLPGPLYGVSKDCWSALAVAVTWNETKCGDAL